MEEEGDHEMGRILSSVLKHDYSFTTQISSEYFCTLLCGQLQKNLECSSLIANQGSSNLITLSAVIEVFEFLSNKEHLTSNQNNFGCDKEITPPDSLQATTQNLLSEGHTESISDWFEETSKILLACQINDLLINGFLRSECKFSTFLLRKVLINGLRTGFFQVASMLQCLESHMLTHNCLGISSRELLKDTVSYALKENMTVAKTTFSWFKRTNMLHKLSIDLKVNISDKELFEYLFLLRKVIKLGTRFSETSKDYTFVSNFFCKVFFPNIQPVLRARKCDLLHQLHLQVFKVFDNLLPIAWLCPDQVLPQAVLEIIKDFQSRAPGLLSLIQSSDCYDEYNFIGKTKKGKSATTLNKLSTCSKLVRSMAVVFLKSCAVLFQKEKPNKDLLHSLQPFLQTYRMTARHTLDETSLQLWLDTHFVDQDDHWISALFCLLTLHIRIKSHIHPGTALQTEEGGICSIADFLRIFCPQKLFLHFVHFIDYDHLVILDFLIAPETIFLHYFLCYLRYLNEDWVHFQSITSSAKDSLNYTDATSEGEPVCKSLKPRAYNAQSPTFENTDVKNSVSVKNSLHIVSYSDSDTDVEDDLLCPPPSKKTRKAHCEASDSCDEHIFSGSDTSTHDSDLEKRDLSCGVQMSAQNENNSPQNILDRVMGMIVRLRMHINRLEEKGLFPYNAKPLIALMEECEERFESS